MSFLRNNFIDGFKMYSADGGGGTGGSDDSLNVNDDNNNLDDNNLNDPGSTNDIDLSILDNAEFTKVLEKLNTNEDFNKYLTSEKDRHFTKGLETWRSKHEETLREQIKKELNPSETPEQVELRALKLQIEQIQNEKLVEMNRVKALEYGLNNGLNKDLIEHFVSADSEKTLKTLEILVESNKAYREQLEEQIKSEIYKDYGFDPNNAKRSINTNNTSDLSEEDILNLLKTTKRRN